MIVVVILFTRRQATERRSLVKLNKIYTRTGDDGTTGLVDGSRVAKSRSAHGGDRRCRRGEQRDRRLPSPRSDARRDRRLR